VIPVVLPLVEVLLVFILLSNLVPNPGFDEYEMSVRKLFIKLWQN
jgi:F0F1-type ATP synthase membrane subunit a